MSDDERDREGDPFEQLEESVGDRDGDPFEQLDDGAVEEPDTGESDQPSESPSASTSEQSPDSGSEPAADDVFEPERFGQEPTDRFGTQPDDGDGPQTGDPSATPDEAETAADSDGSGMTFGIGQRESSDPGAGPTLSETGDRDGDPYGGIESAFAEMEIDQLDPDSVWQELTSAQSRGSVGDARQRTYAEVSKHSYCEQCEHFSEPPDVHCSHDGTEIVEFLDMETVRVVDCPVVAERKELEEGGTADGSDGKD